MKRSWTTLIAAAGLALAACGTELAAARDPTSLAPASAEAPWKPPSPPESYMPAPVDAYPVEARGVYGLADLIDLAERRNPETRRAWEQARASAAALGEAGASWFPTLALVVPGGYDQRVASSPVGTEVYREATAEPRVELSWLLLDFGRRKAEFERARQLLLASNFAFNRKHQDVAFAVQRSFYGYESARAEVEAADQSLETAERVERAAQARRERGLATRPDVLLAAQERARASYELEAARGRVDDAWGALAESIGIPPVPVLAIGDSAGAELPTQLADTVERVMDAALAQRPDLAAQLAELRAREAAVARSRAQYLPRLELAGAGGGALRSYRVRVEELDDSSHHDDHEPSYGAGLRLEWTIFDGFLRDNELRRTRAEADAARAELERGEVEALRQVWAAYADAKTSLRKHEFAEALLAASQESYDAELRSYQEGLATIVDLLAAQRDLARARSTQVGSRGELLTSAAALAWASGGPLRNPP